MVSSKYIYYLFLMNALINIINFVPRVLVFTRFHGALPSIFLSTFIGTLLFFGFTYTIKGFKGQGLPEIFNATLPRFFSFLLLILYAFFWFMAGIITMLSFVDITLRFISPDISSYAVILGFLLLTSICCRLSSESILYALETLLFLVTPIIVYMLVKAFINPAFNWDAVMQVVTFMWTRPKYVSLAGATFIFSGYFNLAIFNRNFKQIKTRHFWMIPVVGLMILLVTFLVPVGYHGTIGVEEHVYSWFSTADSIRMELFIIERVLFLFYTTYLTLALVSTVLHWHVGLELFKGAFQSKEGKKPGKKMDWWVLVPFSAATIIIMNFLDQVRLGQLGQWFLNIRFLNELLLMGVMFYAKGRSAKKT
ncbi:hypothetical protein DFP94_103295 [Fontibacillus phaseoli]|uniref:Spore germination protein n=1 Tax=Fontibacillus phaseoli TaxID=1416533 RepID=A0A369BLJ3_9BACL|nr:hypothetical protein [Fontibacillus phaseoli]RCX20564.1 hypothetical protein DFP94_103295 [Fontibacillus phaseoli]